MSFVIVRDSDKKVLGRIAKNRELSATEKTTQKKLELASTFAGEIYIGGTATTRLDLVGGTLVTFVTAISNPLTLVKQRRLFIKQWLQNAELQPISVWGLNSSGRARNTWGWINMIGAASLVDDNLSTESDWDVLYDETLWSITDWYNTHNTSQWNGVRSLPSTFYKTLTAGATRGNWSSVNGITMPNNSHYGGWISVPYYLDTGQGD